MASRFRTCVGLAYFLAVASGQVAAEDQRAVLKDRSIAYVATHKDHAVYVTPQLETGCPQGLNKWGPREQIAELFPEGTERTYLDTAMAFEARAWFPHSARAKAGLPVERFTFHEAVGPVALGLNLNGKIDSDDFTSPGGENGIDNQLYRAIGCILRYRAPKTSKYMQDDDYHRVVIEITDVDSLANDDDVTLTTYRGNDPLALDASGSGFLPRSSQHVDERLDKMFIQRFHGRIIDGVLETEPNDVVLPDTVGAGGGAYIMPYRDLRWRLRLTEDNAEGIAGAYVDVDEFYYYTNRTLSTHYQTYYQQSSPSFYLELRKLADAYPDPVSGQNTAISMALNLKMKQVFIIRRDTSGAEYRVGDAGRD